MEIKAKDILLSIENKRRGPPWNPKVFILDVDITWDSETRNKYFISKDKNLVIIDGIWYIKKGVQWDGVTHFIDGPEDLDKPGFPITWFATLIHDLGCKYWNEDLDFPYSRFQIDNFFFKLLKKIKFIYSKLYYLCVFSFSIYKTTWRMICLKFYQLFTYTI